MLDLYFTCDRWKTLPEAGGVYDQLAVVMHAFSIISEELRYVELQRAYEQKRKDKTSSASTRRR